MYRNVSKKNPIFVPFGASLTQFGTNLDIHVLLLVVHSAHCVTTHSSQSLIVKPFVYPTQVETLLFKIPTFKTYIYSVYINH